MSGRVPNAAGHRKGRVTSLLCPIAGSRHVRMRRRFAVGRSGGRIHSDARPVVLCKLRGAGPRWGHDWRGHPPSRPGAARGRLHALHLADDAQEKRPRHDAGGIGQQSTARSHRSACRGFAPAWTAAARHWRGGSRAAGKTTTSPATRGRVAPPGLRMGAGPPDFPHRVEGLYEVGERHEIPADRPGGGELHAGGAKATRVGVRPVDPDQNQNAGHARDGQPAHRVTCCRASLAIDGVVERRQGVGALGEAAAAVWICSRSDTTAQAMSTMKTTRASLRPVGQTGRIAEFGICKRRCLSAERWRYAMSARIETHRGT